MTTKAKQVLLAPTKTNTRGSVLQDIREFVSPSTGATNYILVFNDAEVVMPGTWNIRESEFPNGLYVGQKLAAYWEPDNTGKPRFHLSEVK